MTDQHPQRCHTCTNKWRTECPYYAWIEKGNIGISCDSYIEFTSIVGCASHSSATHTPAAPAERLCDDCNILEVEDRLVELEQELKDARKDEREQVLDELTPPHNNQFKGLEDGWKIDSKFLKEIKDALDNPDEWSIDMEEIEVVLIAVKKVLSLRGGGK